MTLDIRPTDDPNHFDLYEVDERVGEITCEPPDPNDPTDTDPPYWSVEVWTQMGTGKTWGGDSESFDEIKQYAREFYEQMVAERRELSKGARPNTISIPMGGQRRR